MKAIAFAIRSFGRELRSGEVLVLLTAVALAVSALTARWLSYRQNRQGGGTTGE